MSGEPCDLHSILGEIVDPDDTNVNESSVQDFKGWGDRGDNRTGRRHEVINQYEGSLLSNWISSDSIHACCFPLGPKSQGTMRLYLMVRNEIGCDSK